MTQLYSDWGQLCSNLNAGFCIFEKLNPETQHCAAAQVLASATARSSLSPTPDAASPPEPLGISQPTEPIPAADLLSAAEPFPEDVPFPAAKLLSAADPLPAAEGGASASSEQCKPRGAGGGERVCDWFEPSTLNLKP